MNIRRNEIFAAILLILSVVVLVVRLLHKDPIGFIVSEGKILPIENSHYFTINDLLLSIIFAWIGGTASLYLLIGREEMIVKKESSAESTVKDKYSYIAHLLKSDEKNIFDLIIKKNGEILQKDLVNESQMSIVQISRILDRLEKKHLIEKKRYGATNKIILKGI